MAIGSARPLRAPAGAAAGTGYRASVLFTASWLIRAGAYVLVGVETFSRISLGPVARPVTIVAYVLSGLMMAFWAANDLRAPGSRPARPRQTSVLLPLALGVITVSSAAACTLPDAGTMLALALIATMDAGSETSLAAGWAVAGAGVLSLEIAALLNDASDGVALGYPLLLLVGLLMGHNRRSYRVQAEQSAALLAQVEELREQQRQVAVLDERTRIAREIHDVLAHSLGALGIQIQAARALLTDHQDKEGGLERGVERAVDVLGVAQRIASDGLHETRRAVHALRTDTPPLDEELERMTATHRQRHGAEVRLTVDGSPVPLPPEHTLALVRTAQESLTNAAKHAARRPVRVALRYGDADVSLSVRNALGGGPGGGFATVDGGYGLTGMRERLLLLGGALSAGAEGGEWVVTARVPR